MFGAWKSNQQAGKPAWQAQGKVGSSIKPTGGIKPAGSAGVKPTPAGGKSIGGAIRPQVTPTQPASKPPQLAAKIGGAVGAQKGAATAAPSVAALKAKITKMTTDFTTLEKQVNLTLESAKKTTENESASPLALKASLEKVEKEMTKISDFQSPITKEREDARKAGPAAATCITDLSKLLERSQKLRQEVTVLLSKLRPKAKNAQTAADNKAKEAKDAAAFKPILAKLTKDVAAVEDVVSAVSKKADPVVAQRPEGEELDKAAAPIETAAKEASTKLAAARKELQDKQASINTYAPEAKKSAHASLSELQKKLAECGKRVSVYQSFKKELPKIIASKEALNQITELLDGHDKALTSSTKLSEMSKIDKEKVEAIDSHLDPVQKAIKEAFALINTKSRMVDAATQASLAELKKKGDEMTKKIQTIFTKVKKVRDVIRSDGFVDEATGKLKKAEEGWTTCQDAEMPFLTGVEVLPGEENAIALKVADDAIATSSTAVNDARTYVKQCLNDAKTFEKELSAKVIADMTPFLAKIDGIAANVAKFKKETAERKITSIMTGALDSVAVLEAKVSAADTDAKTLSPTELEDETEDKITVAIEKNKTSLAEAKSQLSETKKLATEKQREAKAPHNDPASMKINSRLSAAQEKCNKIQSSISSAEKVLKAKQAMKVGEEKVAQAEADVQKVKQHEGSSFTAASVKEFEESCTAATAAIKAASSAVSPFVGAAPGKVKEALQALMERKNEAQKSLDAVRKETKEAREEVLVDAFLAESDTKTKVAETAGEGLDEAEKPFVVGGDLPLAETLATIKKCEEASAAMKEALQEASKFSEQKSRDVKAFGEAAVKKAKEGFAAIQTRIQAAKAKLASFEKDLRDRSKAARMTETSAKVDSVEEMLKKVVAAAEPFTKEGGADMSEADAEVPLKAFMDADKEINAAVSSAKNALQQRSGEQRDNKENIELIKKCQERVSKCMQELATIKKSTKKHEQLASGKLMLADATAQVATLAAVVKKATDACAPLLEQGGKEYLVDHSVRTLALALQAHMKEKELTEETLFQEAGKDAKGFVSYLGKLPEAIGHDELNAFSEERRTEIFKRVSSDGKKISLEDFKGIFKQSYTCIKPVVITDRFEIEGSETVCKLSPNAVLELFGIQKEDANGMVRSECKSDEHKGWVTIKQKKGMTFLNAITLFTKFSKTMESEIAEAQRAVQKVSGFVKEKSRPNPSDEAPLKDARLEIGKLMEKATEANKAMSELQRKVSDAKREYSAKERSESNAHIEARNLKEAAPYFEGPKAKLEAVDGIVSEAENAASSLVSLSGEELQAFATPASVLEVVEKASASSVEKVKELKEALKEQNKVVAEVSPQTGGTAEAKTQLRQIQAKVDEAAKKLQKLLATVKSKCGQIVNPKLDVASSAIRKYAQKESLSGDALFDKFKVEDKITEESFCKLVASLDSTPVMPEVAKLIFQKLGKDGITKDAFLGFFVVYYKVTKTIAFTDIIDIAQCKTLRKASIGEVLELLEDPVKDETNGVTRIRAKATKEPIVEGWVTLSGNQGSEFLEKTKKP